MIKIKQASILILSLLFLAACLDSDSDDEGGATTASCDDVAQPTLEANEEFATEFTQVSGSYMLTYKEVNPGADFTDGEVVDFEITEDGALVIASETVLCHPVLFNGNPAEANWKGTENDLLFGVSNLETGFNEINHASGGVPGDPDFTFLGQFVE